MTRSRFAIVGANRLIRTTLPLIVLVLTVMALAGVQYRWLADLSAAARDRMARDLRVAVQAAAVDVRLEMVRLTAAMERAGANALARGAAWEGWRASTTGLGDFFRGFHLRTDSVRQVPSPFEIEIATVSGGVVVLEIDSLRLVDSMLPRLTRRIERSAELAVSLALVHRTRDGGSWTAGRTGEVSDVPPDVVSSLLVAGSGVEMRFIAFLPSSNRDSARLSEERITWSTDAAPDLGATQAPVPGWELQAWHRAGSLERAAGRLQFRNFAIGFGLIALLTSAGAFTIASLRQNARLAEDRAAILAGISHELRTPLAVLRSAAENLAGGLLDRPADVIEYGKMMEGETVKLERSIQGALAFAQAAHGRSVQREVLDLVALSRETAAAMPDAHRIDIEAPVPVRVNGDASALAVAIRNLFDNALGYSPASSRVTVRILTVGSRGRLTVQDAGAGVPLSERARIFEPFFRGQSAASDARPGLGLGLALAERVAIMHRGRLWLDPAPEGGAVFHLELPVA